MSTLDDTTPDAIAGRTSQLTAQQTGLVVAALVAFLGIAYVGPALTRLGRTPTLKQRMAQRLRHARRRAERAGGKLRRRVRRLGGGTTWR